MPVGINQPSGQIKLTNVSLVRMKKGKKRYEIACYKNKVLEWRSGVEKDLDNVLQIPNVFLSVSKGQAAPTQELAKSFGAKTSLNDIILEILNKGELQVGEKERHAQLERVHNEVIDIVAGKLVDPKTKRVYTTGMIDKALDQLSSQGATQQSEAKATPGSSDIPPVVNEGDNTEPKGKAKELPRWTGVVTTRSAKSQALDAMKALIAHQPIPVARARMRLRITCPTPILKQAVKSAPRSHSHDSGETADGEEKVHGTVKDRILSFVEEVEKQDVVGDEWEVVGFVEPGAFKALSEFIGGQTKGRGRAEVLDMAVVHEDD
ncbi:Shwachman-Bodian-diamond syndrome protein [Lepidopterella palustris CBS 459.81]|uniref:Shwachman-Bodian-diamond syndrome protein n=1 Tax=Lepidopterella palustris CBS 459.81 TaxID=1314670 RepID=A0A8E2EDN4_9PEZI|nr:Shwachman-Bodian-diamond syndrome protein [Lepidopterella palustris CBS 459.81]